MLHGRDAERALIDAVLDRARRSRSGALVIRGEPGAGKTALLRDARERASDMQVLLARGIEAESELPFAGLHQLLRPALRLLGRLPPPQAAALCGALGLAERGGDDRFLVSAAALTLIAELAEERPVLCLVDDVQWLDRSSTDALLFAARRLDAERVAMLFAARDGPGPRFEARELEEVELRGLDAEAAAALVSRDAPGIAPGVRDRLVEHAHGNALALVELPSALSAAQLAGTEELPAALPLTPDVERLFGERVAQLPAPARRLLTLLAIDDGGRLEGVLRAAAAQGIGSDALDAAEQAGLVAVRDGRAEFRHPLVRSAIHAGLPTSARRDAHLALAAALDADHEADRRAWHLAAAALGPDEAVAGELERTAERARLRTGHAAAAAALQRAAELSPAPESRARRLVAAASAAWKAGEARRATELLDAAAPAVAEPGVRAELDHIRGVVELRCGAALDACATLLAGAAAIGRDDPRKALAMLFDAGLAGVDAGDYASIAEAGRRAAALPPSPDDEHAFLADLLAGVGSLVEGRSAAEAPLVLDVIARAGRFDDPRWLVWAAAGAGLAGDEPAEAAILRRAAALARASAAVEPLNMVLLTVGVNGVTNLRFDVVAEAEEGLRLADEAGLANPACIHRAVLAFVAAIKGDEQRSRALAAEAARTARANGCALAHSIAEWGLALLDLGKGRLEETVARLSTLRDTSPGLAHPLYVLMSAADLVEACARSGRDEQARAAYAVLEGFAGPGAPAWSLGLAARCRALLASGAAAEQEFEDALRLHPADGRHFDRARTRLLYGEHLRRRRRRVQAREHLRAAIETLDALGAAPWAARARAELRASGETARRRDPSTLSQLTPQELQVARFVGQGLSNKEVAAQLFLSPRTIDAHLRRVFSKLEISSRTQLAHLTAEGSGVVQTVG